MAAEVHSHNHTTAQLCKHYMTLESELLAIEARATTIREAQLCMELILNEKGIEDSEIPAIAQSAT